MTRRKLFKDLNCLCLELSEYYDINNGGCCYVAAVIAEQLEKYGIPFKVGYVESPTHYAIKVCDRYINRDNFRFERTYEWDSKYLYDEYKERLWNDLYNRRFNLVVKAKIKSIFNKYENSRT